MKITKEEVESRGFVATNDAVFDLVYEKKIADQTVLRFGGQFNGSLELELPDGNDGVIILAPNIGSWDDISALERMFSACWIDTGHTTYNNFGDSDAQG